MTSNLVTIIWETSHVLLEFAIYHAFFSKIYFEVIDLAALLKKSFVFDSSLEDILTL